MTTETTTVTITASRTTKALPGNVEIISPEKFFDPESFNFFSRNVRTRLLLLLSLSLSLSLSHTHTHSHSRYYNNHLHCSDVAFVKSQRNCNRVARRPSPPIRETQNSGGGQNESLLRPKRIILNG